MFISIRRNSHILKQHFYRYYSADRIFENGKLLYSYFPGGYFDADGAAYFTHTDYQGSIIMVTDSDGKVVQHTSYYPYGEPHREPTGQPYLHGGKERLALTHDYDYITRRINSSVLFWNQPDPCAGQFKAISPYVFCAANPVLFTDPSGKRIYIPETVGLTDLFTILLNLQSLTDDHIVFQTQKDGTRMVKIASLGTGSKTTGTYLIRQLNSSDKEIYIDYKNTKNQREVERGNTNWAISSNRNKEEDTPIRYDALVNFDAQFNPFSKVMHNGSNEIVEETCPPYIGLGHELVHAYRFINNLTPRPDRNSYNPYSKEYEDTDELETVGIIGNCPVTENSLRSEHGLPKRVIYGKKQ